MNARNGGKSRHSWAVKDWPNDVFPGSASKGQYLVRIHRRELLQIGALTRIGRPLVIIGEPYTRWLESHKSDVASFNIPPNKPKSKK